MVCTWRNVSWIAEGGGGGGGGGGREGGGEQGHLSRLNFVMAS